LIQNDAKTIIRSLGEVTFEDECVLVTGGAGFLGSWLCQVLVEQGAKVICVDNLSSGLERNISPLLQRDNFKFINHDAAKPLSIDGKIDSVMHLASRASPFEFDKFPIQILKANTLGIWVALGIAKRKGARLLFTSTSEIYGNAVVVPTPETYNGNVNPIGIRGCYDEAKRCGEAFCMAYKRQHGLDVRIARIFNTYGPRMRSDGFYGRAIPRFIDQALLNKPITIFGDGKQTRSFCYITDQIEGLLRLAGMDLSSGEIINIGNPNEISILQLSNIIKRIVGSKSSLEFSSLPSDDPKRRCPNIERAKSKLNWTPKVALEDGLKETAKYFVLQSETLYKKDGENL
jgi:UDP-glucuronate decarboxylase